MYEDDPFLGEEEEDAPLRIAEEGETRGFRSLRIYHEAHALGVACHYLTLQLPKWEMYETGSQLRRAAKSVSANIVEGFGRRRYKTDYLKFLIYAKASLNEAEEHLEYVAECHPEHAEAARTLLRKADELGKRFSRFYQLVELHHNKHFPASA